jgi:UDPglucose--hexose-1-phosphate uridylyltransferase
VVVAAHRQDRPWLGERAIVAAPPLPDYVEGCTFCPRNARVSGSRNPD